MSRSNSSLNRAKKEKNDEFYTLYEDIEKEMQHYDFKGKIIYCPCDDFRWSNFKKYFRDNFDSLGLKKLIVSNYDIGEGAWVYTYDGEKETADRFDGQGGYREHNDLRDEADIIATNPPFSLFRDFFKWIQE